jgi:hypothetical protein
LSRRRRARLAVAQRPSPGFGIIDPTGPNARRRGTNVAGFWDRLRRKKRRPPPATPAQQLKSALEELSFGHERARKRMKGKRHHTDDYREVVIKGDQSAHMSDDLASLTADSYLRRGVLQDEEKRVHLRPGKKASEAEIQQEATQASDEIMGEYSRLGETPDEHYYKATERFETGEVDRTYAIKKKRPQAPPPKKPKGK